MNSYSSSDIYYHGVIPHPELDVWELSIYEKIIPDNFVTLLDLGCGAGEFILQAKQQGFLVQGVDLNNAAVKLCSDKGLVAYQRNAIQTKIPPEHFDIVRAQNILEHLESPEKLILEAKRILRKDGLLIIHVPSNYSTLYPITNFWDDYTHVRPFTRRCLQRILRDFGFKIMYLKGYTVGRNSLETILGKVIEKIIPFSWFLIARKI